MSREASTPWMTGKATHGAVAEDAGSDYAKTRRKRRFLFLNRGLPTIVPDQFAVSAGV